MLFRKITLQIVTGLAAIIIVLLDYIAHDKRTRRFRYLRSMLLVFLVLSIGGGIVVLVEDEKVRSKEINELKQQVDSANRSITGGNNFCYVHLDTARGDAEAMLVVVNDGDSPLYDISFRMWDPADYGGDQNPSQTFEDFLARSLNVNVGNLNPHSAKSLGRRKLRDAESQNFEITIIARNGSFTERLRLRKVNGVWKRAFRVHSGFMNRDESTVLIEKADPDFPRDGTGKIHWD